MEGNINYGCLRLTNRTFKQTFLPLYFLCLKIDLYKFTESTIFILNLRKLIIATRILQIQRLYYLYPQIRQPSKLNNFITIINILQGSILAYFKYPFARHTL